MYIEDKISLLFIHLFNNILIVTYYVTRKFIYYGLTKVEYELKTLMLYMSDSLKSLVHQKAISILNIYVPDKKAPKFVKLY